MLTNDSLLKRCCATIILILSVCAHLQAQELNYPAVKLLQQGQYKEAAQVILPLYDQQGMDFLTNYAMYKLHSAPQYENYNIRKAYQYLVYSHTLYHAQGPKWQKKMVKKGFTETLFAMDIEEVVFAALQETQKVHTEKAYQDFIDYFKRANPRHIQTATQARNTIAWTTAQQTHTVASYTRFIHTYPDAPQADMAIQIRDSLAYYQALQKQNVQELRNFISSYPTAKYVTQAWNQIYQMEYQRAEQINTLVAYYQYAMDYTKSPLRQQAMDKARQLLPQPGDVQAYMIYLKLHRQESNTVKQIRQELYVQARKSLSIELLDFGINYFTSPLQDSCRWLMHHIYASQKDLRELRKFYNKYNHPSFDKQRQHDEALLRMYNDYKAGRQLPENFIRMAAPYYAAYQALIQLIKDDIKQHNWEKAIQVAEKYETRFAGNYAYKELLKTLRAPYDQSIIAIPFDSTINTPHAMQYSVIVGANDSIMYFTGRNRKDNLGQEDVYMSKRTQQGWQTAQLVKGINTANGYESPMALSVDGTTLLLFKNGGMCVTNKSTKGWTTPTPLPDELNNAKWQSDAMITSDGKAMLFAASKKNLSEYQQSNNVYEASNIFVSLMDSNGVWSEPIDLGPTINTPFCDRSPVLHPDMKTLYFCSEGHGTLGDLDVFKSTRIYEDSWTDWTTPVNIGKEINSVDLDCWYRISTDGKKAYFSKTTDKDSKLYTTIIPKNMQPDPVVTIAGRVVDMENKPVGTTIRWENLQTHATIGQIHSDPIDGAFFIVLPQGKNYGYFIDDKRYFPYADHIDLRNSQQSKQIYRNIQVETIERMKHLGTAVRLNNQFFDTNKAILLPASIAELNRVYALISQIDSHIEISGHTDNVGNDQSNQILSQKRAQAVSDYLVQLGIDPSRITIVGYGETKPVADNNTEEGRQLNRRVEIRFLNE